MMNIPFLVLMDVSENEISRIVMDACIKIHNHLGPGLFESVYQRFLAYELEKTGLSVKSEKILPVSYEGLFIKEAFKIDLLVNDLVIIELKSVDKLLPIHKKQLTTYLKLSDKKLGLLINFGGLRLMDGFKRIANGLAE